MPARNVLLTACLLGASALGLSCAAPSDDEGGGGGDGGGAICVRDSDCRGGRCVDFLCEGGSRCPQLGCNPECGEAGPLLDGDGCETCACATACAIDADCDQPGAPGCSATCDGGSCTLHCAGGCQVDSDCGGGEQCVLGSCEPVSCEPDCGGCAGDADCPLGAICDFGRCVACEAVPCDLACPGGYLTDQRGCSICECAGGACTQDSDCPASPDPRCLSWCDRGDCYLECPAGCMDDLDCGPGQSCFDGSCQAGGGTCTQCRLGWYEPVCSTYGQTHANSCMLECSGQPYSYSGECPPGCGCGEQFDPACGYDMITYPSACLAECIGGGAAFPGTCDAGPP